MTIEIEKIKNNIDTYDREIFVQVFTEVSVTEESFIKDKFFGGYSVDDNLKGILGKQGDLLFCLKDDFEKVKEHYSVKPEQKEEEL